MKFHVYRHERRKTSYVIDPPGFNTRGAAGAGRSFKELRKYSGLRDHRWQMAGGRIIKGYAPAMQYALEQALINQWLEKGRQTNNIL